MNDINCALYFCLWADYQHTAESHGDTLPQEFFYTHYCIFYIDVNGSSMKIKPKIEKALNKQVNAELVAFIPDYQWLPILNLIIMLSLLYKVQFKSRIQACDEDIRVYRF